MDSWGRSVLNPVDPVEHPRFDVVAVAPGAAGMDQLALEQVNLGSVRALS